MTSHDILAFGLGVFATGSLWAWRRKNRLAAQAIGQLIADREKRDVMICQLRETIFHQQEVIEKFGHEVETDDEDFKITGDN